jgi:polysaccharide deacetylase 2 family uncharacterized protein YibQ
LVGLAILIAICLTAAMIADLFFHPDRVNQAEKSPGKSPGKSTEKVGKTVKIKPELDVISEKITPYIVVKKSKTKVTGLIAKTDDPIKYEVFEDIKETIVEKPAIMGNDKTPRIAIIIDDIGYDRKIAFALSELDPNITFSVLPFAPYGKQISEKLHKKKMQLMLHLPMEPVEYPNANPGPGAILTTMNPDQLIDQLQRDLKDIPYIVGVNNHMGSKFTAHSDQMNQVFTILKKEKLFFIDSRTAPKSRGKASARLLKLEFAQRDVFLDNLQEIDYITSQFKELIDLAKRHGSAIGIGHPYKATLETLAIELPKLKNKIEIVRASDLISIPE